MNINLTMPEFEDFILIYIRNKMLGEEGYIMDFEGSESFNEVIERMRERGLESFIDTKFVKTPAQVRTRSNLFLTSVRENTDKDKIVLMG